MFPVTPSSKSFMYIKNKIGPSTDPWGTPLKTGFQLETSPSTTTLCLLSFSHCSIQSPCSIKDRALRMTGIFFFLPGLGSTLMNSLLPLSWLGPSGFAEPEYSQVRSPHSRRHTASFPASYTSSTFHGRCSKRSWTWREVGIVALCPVNQALPIPGHMY